MKNNLINNIELLNGTGTFAYLDYSEPTPEITKLDLSIDNGNQEPIMQTIKLTTKKVNLDSSQFTKEYANTDFNKELINAVLEADKSQTVFVPPLTIDSSLSNDLLCRSIKTRLFIFANIVAVESRRGPASYVVLPNELAKYLSEELKPFGKIGGMEILFSSNLKDKLIVGRKSSETDPGLYVFEDNLNMKYDFKQIGNDWYKNYVIATIEYK